MKTLFLIIVTYLAITTSTLQKSIPTVFYGYDGEYNFTIITNDGEETSETITFEETDQTIVDEFNLQSKKSEGHKFIITYTTETLSNTSEEDDAAEEQEEEIINTLIAIKKL